MKFEEAGKAFYCLYRLLTLCQFSAFNIRRVDLDK